MFGYARIYAQLVRRGGGGGGGGGHATGGVKSVQIIGVWSIYAQILSNGISDHYQVFIAWAFTRVSATIDAIYYDSIDDGGVAVYMLCCGPLSFSGHL